MNIDTTKAPVPIQVASQPLIAAQHQGSTRFRYQDHSRGRIGFVGYGLNSLDRNYSPSGKKLKEDIKGGGIIDIYV